MGQLTAKRVVITGGSRGIGLAIARELLSKGAEVILSARNELELLAAQTELRAEHGDRVQQIAADVTKSVEVNKLLDFSIRHGAVSGLVAASGIYGSMAPFAEASFDEWKRAIEVNLIGCAQVVHNFLPHFLKNKEGRIVLFSGGGQAAMPNFSSYVTSKGGIWRFVETLGAELAPQNIFVNAIAPGAVNTRLLDELLEAGPERVGKDFFEKSKKQKASGGDDPGQAARLCTFLMSDEAKGLSGKTLSAKWDDFEKLSIPEVQKSEIYTFKRVQTLDGKTKA